jgi:Tol biopolymer transport system component
MRNLAGTLLVLATYILTLASGQDQAGRMEKTPADNLPPHIYRLTSFGERADWSHDGRKILFLEKTFGDVFEIDLHTREIRPLTHHFHHEGFTRALYLADGDILLSGARRFDAENPSPSRLDEAELWVLSKALDKPPVALGTKCSEGPAVSRKRMTIAWTIDHGDYPTSIPDGVSQIWTGDISRTGREPALVNRKLLLDSRSLPFHANLETQNFRPPDESELIFSGYDYQGTEVLGISLLNGKVTNYSNAPTYEEPEGIFPDGRRTLVECDRHNPKGSQYIDIYELVLDGSGHMERLTFFNDFPGFKASNPVVSDDGRFIAFQMARVGDPAGVGRGIFVYDVAKAAATAKR